MGDEYKHYYEVIFRKSPGEVRINSSCFEHKLGDDVVMIVAKAADKCSEVLGFEFEWFMENMCDQTITVYSYPMGKPGVNTCIIVNNVVNKSDVIIKNRRDE